MLLQQTLNHLKTLKLDGMARAFEEQAHLTASNRLSFEERLGRGTIENGPGQTRDGWNAY